MIEDLAFKNKATENKLLMQPTLGNKLFCGNYFDILHSSAENLRDAKEQDKSSDIEQQPPFGDHKISNIQPQNRGGGLQNQQEHHIILTKYAAVHPTAVSEKRPSI